MLPYGIQKALVLHTYMRNSDPMINSLHMLNIILTSFFRFQHKIPKYDVHFYS